MAEAAVLDVTGEFSPELRRAITQAGGGGVGWIFIGVEARVEQLDEFERGALSGLNIDVRVARARRKKRHDATRDPTGMR